MVTMLYEFLGVGAPRTSFITEALDAPAPFSALNLKAR